MNSLFVNNRDSPPVYKNQPPIAGSIYWEKSLFLRIKHTVIRFQNLEEMTQSNQGKLVSFLKMYSCVYSNVKKVKWQSIGK